MSAKPKDEKKFEELLAELEEIVQDLEGGQVGLDEALEKYEKGIAALKACYAKLSAAEKKIELLTKTSDGSLKTEPFEEGAKEEKPRASAKKSKPKEKDPAPTGKGGSDPEQSLF